MMNCYLEEPDPIERFSRRFTNLMQEVELGLEISDVLHHPDGCLLFLDLHRQLEELQCIVASMREAVAESKKEADVMKEKLHSLKLVEQRLDQALLFNLKTTANQAAPSGNLEKGNHFPDNGQNKENVKENVKKPAKCFPQLNAMLENDFVKLPRHVRGHTTIQQMNEGIAEINHILKSKYEFLNRPRKTLSLKEEKRRAVYLEQAKEVKGTSNATFFVDDDIQRYGTILKMKRKTKDSIFLTLRHIGRIKESHKGKITRYTVLSL